MSMSTDITMSEVHWVQARRSNCQIGHVPRVAYRGAAENVGSPLALTICV